MEEKNKITAEDFQVITTNKALIELAKEKQNPTIDKVLKTVQYEKELRLLQIELVKLQQWVQKTNKRVAIIFEGRDAAGKGGSIRRFTEHLNPRSMRLVALTKPTEVEQGQWYFRRYIKQLPNPGEIAFFDRSWYNRAVVEPVMGFCTDEQYKQYMIQVPEFEHMLYDSGVEIIKFWFSISKEEQQARFDSRLENPLKRWKFSPVDQKGQALWKEYTFHKEQMFSRTHTAYCPWIVVKTNDKLEARLESMRYVLSKFNYDGKDMAETTLLPDPNVVMRYYRTVKQY